jgi:SsrA-binding protein
MHGSSKMSEFSIINKKANFNYFIEETFEAGLVLQGWEFKSLLSKKANLDNSYVIVKDGELFLLNSLIQPAQTVSTHVPAEATRSLNRLIGQVEQKGYTLMPLKIIRGRAGKLKLIFGLAKGKKDYDKRQSLKDKDWDREREMLFKKSTKSNFD